MSIRESIKGLDDGITDSNGVLKIEQIDDEIALNVETGEIVSMMDLLTYKGTIILQGGDK